MKFSLRSLIIVSAALPPTIGFVYWFAGLPLTLALVAGIAFWLFVFANRERTAV